MKAKSNKKIRSGKKRQFLTLSATFRRGILFARIHVKGKLIRRSLKTRPSRLANFGWVILRKRATECRTQRRFRWWQNDLCECAGNNLLTSTTDVTTLPNGDIVRSASVSVKERPIQTKQLMQKLPRIDR